MYADFLTSPNYQFDQSFYHSKLYFDNDNDNNNWQRQNNNNITLIDNNINPIFNLDYYEKKNEDKENLELALDKNNEEDNFNDTGFKTPSEKNQSKNILEQLNNLGNSNTKATSLITGKKRKRKSEKLENKGKSNCGRKKKDSRIKGNHNKNTEDNIMRKIKTNFLKYINMQLNKKLKNKEHKFLKLDSKINENLKKDYNEHLMKTKIKNLYLNSEISSKYRTKKAKYSDINIKLIEEIYNDYGEYDIIDTLELTYLDLFKEFRNTYLDEFLNHIRNEELKKDESEEDINSYLENIKNLCLNYEEWFNNKKGRNRNKNSE